jgi:hypothetical protein
LCFGHGFSPWNPRGIVLQYRVKIVAAGADRLLKCMIRSFSWVCILILSRIPSSGRVLLRAWVGELLSVAGLHLHQVLVSQLLSTDFAIAV